MKNILFGFFRKYIYNIFFSNYPGNILVSIIFVGLEITNALTKNFWYLLD